MMPDLLEYLARRAVLVIFLFFVIGIVGTLAVSGVVMYVSHVYQSMSTPRNELIDMGGTAPLHGPLPATPANLVVTIFDKQAKVELSQGEVLVVKLPIQPGTAYAWELKHSELQLYGLTQEEIPGETEQKTIQVTHYQVFRFLPTQLHESTLEFHYRRPWDQSDPRKVHIVKVKVDREPE
jgi:predicted secreted protein